MRSGRFLAVSSRASSAVHFPLVTIMETRPKKGLGQHFLVNRSIARRIVKAFEDSFSGPILEVGPGRGVLTDCLARLDRPVIAVEKDRELARFLSDRYEGSERVRIITGDILSLDLRGLAEEGKGEKLAVIGNIPFRITSPLLELLLDNRDRIEGAVLMLQREVADRLTSPPGCRQYGALTVVTNYLATVDTILHVRRGSFFPIPEVDATVLRITPGGVSREWRAGDVTDFMRIVRTLFGWRRKQIQKTLRLHPGFQLTGADLSSLEESIDYPLTVRPEDLTIRDYVRLANRIREIKDNRCCPH